MKAVGYCQAIDRTNIWANIRVIQTNSYILKKTKKFYCLVNLSFSKAHAQREVEAEEAVKATEAEEAVVEKKKSHGPVNNLTKICLINSYFI